MKSLKQLIIFVVWVIMGIIGLVVVVIVKSEKIRSLIRDKVINIILGFIYGRRPSGELRCKYMNRFKYAYAYKYAERCQTKIPDIKWLVFATRRDAEAVFSKILDHLDSYRSISVGDIHDITENSSTFRDFQYGWTEKDFISAANIVRCKDGYIISAPPVRGL